MRVDSNKNQMRALNRIGPVLKKSRGGNIEEAESIGSDRVVATHDDHEIGNPPLATECREVHLCKDDGGVIGGRQENSGVYGQGRPRWQTGDPDWQQAATQPGGRSSSCRGKG
jgi:hypothetical protein